VLYAAEMTAASADTPAGAGISGPLILWFFSWLFFFPSEALGLCPVLAFAIGH
jgi:hypothetical protein